jgi:hypothetical protein
MAADPTKPVQDKVASAPADAADHAGGLAGKSAGNLAADLAADRAGGLAAMIARAAEQAGAVSGEGATKGGRGLPPVETWNPPFCGDIDMEIRADGTWFYMGTPIGRAPLVRLFSTVLRRDEDGKTYLVTPVEKVGIRVVDAPFLAVEMEVGEMDVGEPDVGEMELGAIEIGAVESGKESGEPVLTFRTNVGDVVAAGAAHPLRFQICGDNNELKPYLTVRGRLEALLSRAVMYQLVERGETIDVDGLPMFAVRSGGMVFAIMPQAELEGLSR